MAQVSMDLVHDQRWESEAPIYLQTMPYESEPLSIVEWPNMIPNKTEKPILYPYYTHMYIYMCVCSNMVVSWDSGTPNHPKHYSMT